MIYLHEILIDKKYKKIMANNIQDTSIRKLTKQNKVKK